MTQKRATALHIAAQHDQLDATRLLLEVVADKGAATLDSTAALQLAAQNGHTQVAQLLR